MVALNAAIVGALELVERGPKRELPRLEVACALLDPGLVHRHAGGGDGGACRSRGRASRPRQRTSRVRCGPGTPAAERERRPNPPSGAPSRRDLRRAGRAARGPRQRAWDRGRTPTAPATRARTSNLLRFPARRMCRRPRSDAAMVSVASSANQCVVPRPTTSRAPGLRHPRPRREFDRPPPCVAFACSALTTPLASRLEHRREDRADRSDDSDRSPRGRLRAPTSPSRSRRVPEGEGKMRRQLVPPVVALGKDGRSAAQQREGRRNVTAFEGNAPGGTEPRRDTVGERDAASDRPDRARPGTGMPARGGSRRSRHARRARACSASRRSARAAPHASPSAATRTRRRG